MTRKKGFADLVSFLALAGMIVYTLFVVAGPVKNSSEFNQHVFLSEASAFGERQLETAKLFIQDVLYGEGRLLATELAAQGGVPSPFLNAANSKNEVLYWYSDDFADPKLRIPPDYTADFHEYENAYPIAEEILSSRITDRIRNYVVADDYVYTFLPLDYVAEIGATDEQTINISAKSQSDEHMIVAVESPKQKLEVPVILRTNSSVPEVDTGLPYWRLHEESRDEAALAPDRKDDLQQKAESLNDKVVHTDNFCESSRTACKTFTCDQLYVNAIGGPSPDEYFVGQIQSHIEDNWDDTYPSGDELEYNAELSPSSGSRLVVPSVSGTPPYTGPTSAGTCGCRSGHTVCGGDPFTCTFVCDVYWIAYKCQAECTYDYAFNADIAVDINSKKKILFDGSWADFMFKFREFFRNIEDRAYSHPASYATN